MDYRDYYTVLGVPKTASAKEIRSAFRKLARKHHPDVNPGDADAGRRFKELNEAHDVLSDPEKRRLYDVLGPKWAEYEQYRAAGGTASPAEFAQYSAADTGPRPAGAGSGPSSRRETRMSDDDLRDIFGQQEPYSDFFRSIFGDAAGGARGPRRGGDTDLPVEITLEDAIRGTSVQVQFTEPGGVARAIEAKIPPGVRSGSRIRLAGQGNAGSSGGARGDLFLVVTVRPHARFRREGDNLHLPARVDLYTCILGGEIHVDTPTGKRLAVRVPPETQNGSAIKLAGQGVPHLHHPERKGDMFVEISVTLPTRLSNEEKDLYGTLAELRKQHGGVGRT
jgi:curved DNA-binding protein